MLPFRPLFLSLSILIGGALAFPHNDDHDLTSFITRPEIKAPKFHVKVHNKDRVSPGYWFVAPYWQIRPEAPTDKWVPCQVGPHIYDADGTLIWTGACRYENSNIFDFHTVEIDNRTHITFLHNNDFDSQHTRGSGMILDENYHVRNEVPAPDYVATFNMHEFNVIDNGKSALSTLYKPRLMDLSDLDINAEGWVTSGGFFESDVATGEVLFTWDGYKHIPLNETALQWPQGPEGNPGLDYVHVNAADKTPDGDYILSARFTDTIYKISGKTGEIVWRLGGKQSDFKQDFKFRRQHHVRHVESNSTHMTISFLNNASDEGSDDGTPSSAFFVSVQTSGSTMKATLVDHYDRPDGDLTRLRGSTQLLPDGNVFVGWSQQGYHSEFTPDGEVVMEANFVSDRYSSYRSYKSEWVGKPTTPPTVKSMAFGPTTSELSTTIWVSWNGATEIASWNFYGRASQKSESVLIGNARKTDFETMFMASGYMGWVSAEALDADGNSLGISEVEETDAPGNWKAAGFDPDEDRPDPMDPNVVIENKEEADSEVPVAQLEDDLNQHVYDNSSDTSAAHLDDDDSDESFTDKVSNAFESNDELRVFCISLLVVVACGILLGFFWFFRPYLRRSKESYLPVAKAEGDDRYDDGNNYTPVAAKAEVDDRDDEAYNS